MSHKRKRSSHIKYLKDFKEIREQSKYGELELTETQFRAIVLNECIDADEVVKEFLAEIYADYLKLKKNHLEEDRIKPDARIPDKDLFNMSMVSYQLSKIFGSFGAKNNSKLGDLFTVYFFQKETDIELDIYEKLPIKRSKLGTYINGYFKNQIDYIGIDCSEFFELIENYLDAYQEKLEENNGLLANCRDPITLSLYFCFGKKFQKDIENIDAYFQSHRYSSCCYRYIDINNKSIDKVAAGSRVLDLSTIHTPALWHDIFEVRKSKEKLIKSKIFTI